MLFSASLLFKSYHSVQSETDPLWEDVIVLVEAESEVAARSKGIEMGKARESSFPGEKGDTITWKFETLERLCQVEEPLSNGTDLFSRFLRDGEVKSLLTKFED